MKMRKQICKAEAAPTPAASDETADPKATHRLTDISVKEVSIVDRGANKRTYLVVKDDPQPPAPPAAPTAPAPPTLRISAELKTKVLGQLTTAQERIGVIQKVLEGASETPGAPPPQELMDALAQLAALFTDTAQPPAAAPPAPPPAAPPPPAAKGDPAETEKAGRKMSAARIAQLEEMRTTLSTMISEVSGDSDKKDEEEEKAAPASTEKTAAAPVIPPAPIPELDELKTSVKGISETMDKMFLVFQGQKARIDELSKSRGASRQVDVDGSDSKPKSTKVIWDTDMASPTKVVQ